MKIGILAPSNINQWKEAVNIDEEVFNIKINELVDSLVSLEHEIVIVPAKNSLPMLIGAMYQDKGGSKVLGVIPMDDAEFGIDELDEFFCDEIINCVTWRNQPEKFCESVDILLVIGFSEGVLVEIGQSKRFGKTKTIILEDFITAKLPVESTQNIDLKYVKLEDLEHYILN
jgi:hypothetical protein